MGNIAIMFGDLGQHMKALRQQQAALAMERRVCSPDDPTMAQTMINMSTTMNRLGQVGATFLRFCPFAGGF
jgi:hypothetical protein